MAIVGGGLAGLTCALSLGRAGFEVTVYESTGALGGKAGVRTEPDLLHPDRAFPLPSEHGPHFIAGWYRSLLSLARELGVEDRLVGYSGFRYLLPTPPSALGPREIDMSASLRAMPRLVSGRLDDGDDGQLSWRMSSQLASMAFDLLTNLRRIERADDASLAAYISDRWYGDDALAAMANDQVLRASAISADEVSVRTMARLMALWFQYPRPFLSVFDADLGTILIEPLSKAVEAVARIRFETPILGLADDEEGRVAGVRHGDGSRFDADVVVSAAPCEVLAGWVSDGRLAGELGGVAALRAAPMSSVQLVFDGKLRGIPPGVVYLWNSEPAVNAIDLSQTWRSLSGDPRTVLSVVVSDHAAIRDLDEKELVDLVLRQLAVCVPDVARVNLASAVARANTHEPLFINTAGSWADRPSPSRPYGGGRLYVIGDYARTPVDLACMEGAVLAGILSAEAIASSASRSPGLTAVLPESPRPLRRLAYQGARFGMAPITAAGKLTRPGALTR